MTVFVLIFQLTRFCQDIAGIDKALRLIQSFAQITAALSLSPAAAAPWLQAHKQFALTRRYLRFMNFVDYFTSAYEILHKKLGILSVLEFGKWSTLGIYVLLESSTIMDAMGIWSPVWTKPVYDEAMRFWFYSIVLSIVLRIIELRGLYRSPPVASEKSPATTEVTEKEKVVLPEEEKILAQKQKDAQVLEKRERAEKRSKERTELAIDICNLFNPGTSTGWMPVSSGVQGTLMVVSTLLASTDIWVRVQSG